MKKKKTLQVIAGCVLILASIWGGAFMLHYLPDWLRFSGYCTAMITFIVGVFIAAAALIGGDGL